MKNHLIIIFTVLLFNIKVFSQYSTDSTLLLYPENITKITFNNNDRIKSAYYKLEAAKYNFKLFESKYAHANARLHVWFYLATTQHLQAHV